MGQIRDMTLMDCCAVAMRHADGIVVCSPGRKKGVGVTGSEAERRRNLERRSVLEAPWRGAQPHDWVLP